MAKRRWEVKKRAGSKPQRLFPKRKDRQFERVEHPEQRDLLDEQRNEKFLVVDTTQKVSEIVSKGGKAGEETIVRSRHSQAGKIEYGWFCELTTSCLKGGERQGEKRKKKNAGSSGLRAGGGQPSNKGWVASAEREHHKGKARETDRVEKDRVAKICLRTSRKPAGHSDDENAMPKGFKKVFS